MGELPTAKLGVALPSQMSAEHYSALPRRHLVDVGIVGSVVKFSVDTLAEQLPDATANARISTGLARNSSRTSLSSRLPWLLSDTTVGHDVVGL